MPRLSTLLLLALIGITALQLRETRQLKKEFAAMTRALTTGRPVGVGKFTPGDLKEAGRKFEAASKAAAKGDAAAAAAAGRDAVALLEQDPDRVFVVLPLSKELAATREFVQKQISGIYRPQKVEPKK